MPTSYEHSNKPLDSLRGTKRALVHEERDNSVFDILVTFCN